MRTFNIPASRYFLISFVLFSIYPIAFSCKSNKKKIEIHQKLDAQPATKLIGNERKKTSAPSKLHTNEDTIKGIYTKNGKSLPYSLLQFGDTEKVGQAVFILFLHGAGERGTENANQLKVGLPNLIRSLKKQGINEIVVLAPQCPPNQQWVNTDWAATSHRMNKEPHWPLELALDVMDSILKTHSGVDQQRKYVTGLSMGGYGTWEVIQRRPSYFAAAIPICGGGDKTMGSTLKDIPIWMFHGKEDKAVPVIRTIDMNNAIKSALGSSPMKAKMTIFENKGHLIWNQVYDNAEVINWLLNQRIPKN